MIAEAVPNLNNQLALDSAQMYAALVGALVPSITYFINYHAPWLGQPVKATFLACVAAASGAIVELIDVGKLTFDTNTLQIVGSAVVLAFIAHVSFWKPSTINTLLGGGQNVQDKAAPETPISQQTKK